MIDDHTMTITEYAIISVNRKEGVKLLYTFNFKQNRINELLTYCLPFGDPHDISVKLTLINGVFYLALLILDNKNNGKGIISPITDIDEENHFNRDLINEIFSLLQFNSEPDTFLSPNEYTVKYSQLISSPSIQFSLTAINNANNLLISLLVGRKIYVLGPGDKFLDLIEFLFNLFPCELHFLLRFVLNSNSLSENTQIIRIPLTKNNLHDLDKINKEKNTVLDLDNKICYGFYSSPLIDQVIEALEQYQIHSAKKIFSTIYKIALHNDANDNVSKLSKLHKINKNDAIMILKLRNLIYDKKWKGNLFDELVS